MNFGIYRNDEGQVNRKGKERKCMRLLRAKVQKYLNE